MNYLTFIFKVLLYSADSMCYYNIEFHIFWQNVCFSVILVFLMNCGILLFINLILMMCVLGFCHVGIWVIYWLCQIISRYTYQWIWIIWYCLKFPMRRYLSFVSELLLDKDCIPEQFNIRIATPPASLTLYIYIYNFRYVSNLCWVSVVSGICLMSRYTGIPGFSFPTSP